LKAIGDSCNVRIIDYTSGGTPIVRDDENNISGILMMKEKKELKLRSNNTVKAWIIKIEGDKYIFSNSYFGKFTISESISKRYVKILEKILGYSKEQVEPNDISELKGMVNRCLKRDQWDWFTTYSYLGYPSTKIMRRFVDEAIILRQELKEGNTGRLDSFISNYQYMLISIYSHLSGNAKLDTERLDIPLLGFDKNLWDKLQENSRENLILVEQMNKQVSKYMLMHYFVTLEQEFLHNFIKPFQLKYKNEIKTFKVYSPYWETTHKLLCGTTHFSLGAVYYLGKCFWDKDASTASEAINNFVNFIDNKEQFIQICDDIASKIICGLKIKDIRNGLAHGDHSISNTIGHSAFDDLRNFLFIKPEEILKRILIYSMIDKI
jgi:hypothetical protein